MLNESELTRILFSLRDFQLSLSALTFLIEEYPENADRIELRRFGCYETTVVVSYGRPFSMSYHPLPRFNFELVGFIPCVEEVALHQELMSLRDKKSIHPPRAAA